MGLFTAALQKLSNPLPNRPQFPLEAWEDKRYDKLFQAMRTPPDELEAQRIAAQDVDSPMFSIVVPLYETPQGYLEDMVESVLAQTYPRWQLVLVNASPDREELVRCLADYSARDDRITVVPLEANFGITENTNRGIEAATGDFVCFMDHDDWIEPDTLFEYAVAVRGQGETDVVYCDEDLCEKAKGTWRHLHPLFKPDYSPELLLSKNYIIHFLAVRKTIIDALPVPGSEFDGSQDYNMTLAATEQARQVCHISKVLYHFRVGEGSTAADPGAKPYRLRSARLSLQGRLDRTKLPAKVIETGTVGTHSVWFRPDGARKVSLVAVRTTADPSCTFGSFLESFSQVNTYENVEVLLVGSKSELSEVGSGKGNVRLIEALPNTSALDRFNEGAKAAEGGIVIFLDSGCVFVSPSPLEQYVGLHDIQGVGVVAPKTLYFDYTVKSYGVGVSREGVMPLYRGYPFDYPGYLGNVHSFQNTSGVGLQGMSVKRNVFEVAGGFAPGFAGEVGAVALCQKALREDQRVVAACTVMLATSDTPPDEPYGEAYPDYPSEEIEQLRTMLPGGLETHDPYRNPMLDCRSGYPLLRIPE